MLRFGIGILLAMAMMALASEPASAQNYPCPNGPGPGERQVGTVGGGNSGVAPVAICERTGEPSQPYAPSPAPQLYWVENFVAVAWHPNASDAWAVSRARSDEEARREALALCEAAMKNGCTIATSGSNGSVALARSSDGLLLFGWGATPKKAKQYVLASCLKEGSRCVYERTFTGERWMQPVGTMLPPWLLVRHLPPAGKPIRNRYGALAWVEGPDPRWGRTVWVSGDLDTVEEAEKSSLARCEKDSQLKCKIGRWNSNGVIILYKDAQDSLLASGGLSESDAKKGVKEVCKKARRKCEALAVFDTRQAGVVTRSFPDRPVAK